MAHINNAWIHSPSLFCVCFLIVLSCAISAAAVYTQSHTFRYQIPRTQNIPSQMPNVLNYYVPKRNFSQSSTPLPNAMHPNVYEFIYIYIAFGCVETHRHQNAVRGKDYYFPFEHEVRRENSCSNESGQNTINLASEFSRATHSIRHRMDEMEMKKIQFTYRFESQMKTILIYHTRARVFCATCHTHRCRLTLV